jgi:hypothetical protein
LVRLQKSAPPHSNETRSFYRRSIKAGEGAGKMAKKDKLSKIDKKMLKKAGKKALKKIGKKPPKGQKVDRSDVSLI